MKSYEKVFMVPDNMRMMYLHVLPDEVKEKDPVIFVAADMRSREICGVMAVQEYDGGWEILFLVVFEEYRRRGFGRVMIELCIQFMSTLSVQELSCSYSETATDEDRALLEKFFMACGFIEASSSEVWRMNIMDIELKHFPKAFQSDSFKNIPLSESNEELWGDLLELIRERSEEDDGSGGDIFLELKDMSEYDPDISHICVDIDGEPKGCVLAKWMGDDLVLSYLFVDRKNTGAGVTFRIMLPDALDAAKQLLRRRNCIYANAQNPIVGEMVEDLTKGKAELYGKFLEMVRTL